MLRDGLRRLIRNASISSVSVLKRHFFSNVKFCSAGIVSLQYCFSDVTSLFTNVPVDLVIDDIANKLFSYEVASKLPFLQAKKPITQNIFKKLLKLSTEGMFIHNGKLFSQSMV